MKTVLVIHVYDDNVKEVANHVVMEGLEHDENLRLITPQLVRKGLNTVVAEFNRLQARPGIVRVEGKGATGLGICPSCGSTRVAVWSRDGYMCCDNCKDYPTANPPSDAHPLTRVSLSCGCKVKEASNGHMEPHPCPQWPKCQADLNTAIEALTPK